MDNASWAKDAWERVGSTFIQVVIAAVLTAATEALVQLEAIEGNVATGIILATFAAVLAAVKAWWAKRVSGTVSPASLVKR